MEWEGERVRTLKNANGKMPRNESGLKVNKPKRASNVFPP